MPAYHPLAQVKSLVHPPPGAGPQPTFNAPKSTDVVSERLGMSLKDAKTFICDNVLELTDGNYYETKPTPPPPADIYGVEARRIGWYVKLKILNAPRLKICAFHPPTDPFRTANGLWIKRTA